VVYAKALGTLQFACTGRVAWLEMPRAMIEAAGPGADSGGLSGFAGSIQGVDVGFQIEEGADGNVYAGFRSQTVDVAALCGGFALAERTVPVLREPSGGRFQPEGRRNDFGRQILT